MASISHETSARPGLTGAFRRLRDPLLLCLPVTFALLLIFLGYANAWPIGFDFRGTLWEPARALLDGTPIYPPPTRDAIVVGNPSVYPPLFIIVSVPLALLPVAVASWLWFVVLGAAVLAALWILEVHDARCYILAITSPPVVQGLYFGNLTVLLLVPFALSWRYRDRARVAGVAVGAAVAAKLFVWPLVVWLLLTRRPAAAAWASVSAVALALGAWALIGFEGLADYPALIRAVQDVYANHSYSLSTVVASLGASRSAAVAVAAVAGLAMLGGAAWAAHRADGDRRSFALAVGACVVASPIVWPNYAALLLVPIAITWPRLAPAWFFGYGVWLTEALAPEPIASYAEPPPAGVPEQAWLGSHGEPFFWYGAALTAVVVGVVGLVAVARSSRGSGQRGTSRRPTRGDRIPTGHARRSAREP